MINESGLYPKGVAILVRPYEVQEKTSAIVLPETVRAREVMAETRAVVIAIGPEAWKDESQARAQIGSHVMLTRFAGIMAVGPKDGVQYRLINDRDIFCEIDIPEETV